MMRMTRYGMADRIKVKILVDDTAEARRQGVQLSLRIIARSAALSTLSCWAQVTCCTRCVRLYTATARGALIVRLGRMGFRPNASNRGQLHLMTTASANLLLAP